jgi:predicted extracellular nuclease
MRFARTAVTALVASTALIGVAQTQVATAADAPTELFISEYIEGSSNNKAIEIYNGTGAPIDLSTYSVQMYFNANATVGLTIPLVGTIADGDVFVLAQASATFATGADQTSSASWFNGNDTVILTHDGTIIDSVGQIAFNSEWGSDATSTQDNTLRRKPTVCAGDSDPTDTFDPAPEWDGFAQDTFDGLGTHAVECGDVTPPPPVINEFSASTAGTDVEYVEILGAADTDLSAYAVLEIEGDSGSAAGTIDEVVNLGATNAEGRLLVSLPAGALENGTITLLLVEGFTGVLGADLDENNDGAFDVTPWSSIVDAVAVNDGGAADLTYAAPALGPNYDGVSSFAPGGASRIPDGLDTDAATDWVRNDFDLLGIPGFEGTAQLGEAINTPGAANDALEPSDIPATPYAIHDVQGAGSTSPVDGTRVIIDGIVVGDFQNNAGGDDGDLGGFFVQEPDSDVDADTRTSEGIFVFDGGGTVDVVAGDLVTVTGTVDEFNGLTEITSVEVVTVLSSGNPLPAPTSLVLPASDDMRESVEGMYVTLPQDLVITEYFNFDRFGEIVVATDRQPTPTAVVEPGPEAVALEAEQALARITVDDGRTSQNPDPAIHPNGAIFDLGNRFRGGDTVTNITGVMQYSFDLWRIQPTEGADYTVTNPRPIEPPVSNGSLTVASFNVLNYFNTIDDGTNDICGPDLSQECRGADDQEERVRQLDKIVAAMSDIDADVFGIIEVENTTGVEAMADIVDGLNAEFGADTYTYVDTGTIGTDAIKLGFIYKSTTVQPFGDYAILDSSFDPAFIDTKNRPSLAQTFEETATGRLFTVAVNHFKSKGSDCNDVGDPDALDGQGNCNLTRTAAAVALAEWLDGNPTGEDAPTLIVGDLNAYDLEDPIDALKAAGYTDLIAKFQGPEAYSYVFDGKIGYLDHALADGELEPLVLGAAPWHINADEPDLLDYDTSFKQAAQDALYEPNPFRSSDHDPVVVDLVIDPATAIGLAADEVDALLATGTINRGQANALYKRLDSALAMVEAGSSKPASAILGGILGQIDDFVDDGVLTTDEAATLRRLVGAAIASLD